MMCQWPTVLYHKNSSQIGIFLYNIPASIDVKHFYVFFILVMLFTFLTFFSYFPNVL